MVEALQLVSVAVGADWAPVVALCFSLAACFTRGLCTITTKACSGGWWTRIHDSELYDVRKVGESVRAAALRDECDSL